jgi:hypothetical protein
LKTCRPFSFSRDDVRRGQLLQVACNYRAILRQAIGDCGDVGASRQNELAENGDACRLAECLEEAGVEHRDTLARCLLSGQPHSVRLAPLFA